jgi:hypothetical protein
MPEYTIQDAETGRELIVEGAIPPTPADMEELFAAEYQREETALAPPVEEIIPEPLIEYPTEVEAPEAPIDPEDELGMLGTFTGGASRGFDRLGSTFTDIIPAIAGSAIGNEEYALAQLAEAEEKRRVSELENPTQFESYKEVEGVGDFSRFVSQVVGEQIGNIGLVVGTGLAAVATAPVSVPAGAALLGGTALGSYALNAPEVFENIYQETGETAPGVALLFGAGAAALDSVLPYGISRSMSGPLKAGVVKTLLTRSGMSPGVLRSGTAGLFAGLGVEGITEGGQEAISIAAERFVDDNPEAFGSREWGRIMESVVQGAIAGGVFGGVGGGIQGVRESNDAKELQARLDEETAIAKDIAEDGSLIDPLTGDKVVPAEGGAGATGAPAVVDPGTIVEEPEAESTDVGNLAGTQQPSSFPDFDALDLESARTAAQASQAGPEVVEEVGTQQSAEEIAGETIVKGFDEVNPGVNQGAAGITSEELDSLQEVGDQQAAVENKEPIVPGAKKSANVGGPATQPDPVYATFSNARKAIDYIKKNTTNKLLRNLANRLAPVMGNTQLVVVTDSKAIVNTKTRNLFNSSGTQAVYDEGADTIYVNPETGINEEVILHEATHKGTAAKVTIYENADPTNEGLTPKEVLYLDKIKSLMQAANKSFLAKEAAENSIETDRNLADAGAFTNLYEFIAYGRTNGAMQQLLNGMPSTEGKGTLFAQFVELLRQLFNIPASQKNAFMELVKASDSLLVPTSAQGNAGQILANRKISDATQKRIEQLKKDIRNGTGGPKKVLANTGELMALTRDGRASINTLKGAFSRMSDKAVVAIGKVLTTTDISRWIRDVVPGVSQINKDIQNFAKARNKELAKLHTRIQPWVAFKKAFAEGEKKLAEVMHLSRIAQVDLTEWSTAEESIANDETLNGNNEQGSNKVVGKYEKLADPNISDTAQTKIQQEIDQREAEIRALYKLWNELGTYDNKQGHKIYKMAKDAYQETFEKYQLLLVEHITNSSSNPETQAKLINMVTLQYQNANQLKVYFPLMRYGNFWIAVGKGSKLQFHMRETAKERDNLLAEIIAEDNLGTETERMTAGDIRVGNELEEGHQDLVANTEELKEIFALIDNSGNSAQDRTMLKDEIYQLYLLTLPPGALRRKFLRSNNTPGYSKDAFRNFITSQSSSANQLARFEFSPKLDLSIEAAKASLEGMPIEEGLYKYQALVREMEKRARAEINPVIPEGFDFGKLASIGNQIAFVYMLTSPKSALIQLTQVPVVGIPTLIAQGYPKAEVLRVLGGYLKVFGRFGKAEEVSVINSKYIEEHENSAQLKAGFQIAQDLGILNVTYSADLSARKKSPTDTFDKPAQKTWRGFVDMMGFLFHHSERLSREVMFMSSMELELNRLKKTSPNLSEEAAVEQATEKAVELTYETLFNYTLYEKPPLMKHPVGKVATQFLTYPLQMTSFLVRNFFGTVWPTIPIAERKAAATKFFGTIGMTTLFAGAVGVPGYTAIMGMAEGIRESFRPDEDDEDADPWYDENDEGNPLGKRNLDLWFREWWIPTMFGPGGSIATALGLTPEQAQALARGFEMGPISALADWNIGSSVTLDHLWFQDSVPSDDMKGAFTQFLFDTFGGPLGAMGSQIASGVDDMNEGNFNRGFEKFAPAFFRGPMKAFRISQEGTVTSGQRAKILDAEFYTMGKLLGQGLNFQSTTEAEIQKATFLAKRLTVEVQKERSKVLNQINMAFAKDMENSTERTQANIDAALDAVYEYNYRNGFYAIGGDDINQSLQGRARTRATADQGLVVSQKDLAPLASDLVRSSRTN